jgi:hypothetical protein
MEQAMNSLIEKLARSRVFKSDFDYHLVRRSMGNRSWVEGDRCTDMRKAE